MGKNLLPFEIDELEAQDKKVMAGLKKIEIYVSPEQVNDILHLLEKLELEATSFNSQGFGKSKQMLRAGKSGGQNRIIPSERKTIMTIAESSVIAKLVEEIKHLNDKKERKIGVLSIQPVDALIHL
jgi:nitrogen regulatory protein PII